MLVYQRVLKIAIIICCNHILSVSYFTFDRLIAKYCAGLWFRHLKKMLVNGHHYPSHMAQN
jgi:hypothetical protein